MGALLPDGPIDTLGVLEAIQSTPEMIAAALEVEVAPPTVAGRGVVLVASGADAMVARAARALVAHRSPVPVFVDDGAGLPGFASDAWRVIFVSRAETPEARAALRIAVDHRIPVEAIGSGSLVETAAEMDASVVRLVDDVPAARFAFGSTLVATLRVLDAHGAIVDPVGEGSLVDDVDAAISQLERRRIELDGAGDAARLARRIGRTFPLVYAAGALGEVAAWRWKQQINDNAKAPAFAGALPGLGHHEINGWGQHGDVTRQVFSMITLRHDFETVEERHDFTRVEALMDEVVNDQYAVEAAGHGPLAQLLDLVYVGDLVSYHLAQVNEIDPGPTAAALDAGA